MSDFVDSITYPVRSVFPQARRAKCYYHLKSNLIKRYTKKKYVFLEDYITSLVNCLNENELNFVWGLIKKEISTNKNIQDFKEDFVQYFERTYMNNENKYFYIGALPPGYSNTNNLLEGHHSHIKRNIFGHKVRSIGQN